MTSKPIRVNLAGEADIDPRDIYYTHSKIRPFFSGCGKRIVDTIAEIESGQISAKDLPQISVIQDAEGHTYCMNNRRLYVFKHLRRMGLLEGDVITVRVKKAIPRELAKYNPQNCSLNCTIIREKAAIQVEKELEKQKEEEDISNECDQPDTAEVSEKRVKHDKKSQQVKPEETDEERYFRQKQRIEQAREQYKKDAAERLRQKQERDALLKESGACDDSDTESSEDEPEEELFVCNLCSKEFKSVEQIEQHFQSKVHKKNVQESIRKKKERERKAANRELGRQRKLEKEKAAQAASVKASGQGGQEEVTVEGLSLLPPSPPTKAREKAVEETDLINKINEIEEIDREEGDSSESDSASQSGSESDSGDEDFLLVQMASRKCRQGLPDADSDSDSD
mmetsp:Transcript_3016/g.5402  ORF Transcript_3016/g.5402 Transcript_3016/m.5402 type:complete len:396 (-) Transcript_3016:246-1433(-)